MTTMTEALRIAPIDYPFPEKPAILSAERSKQCHANCALLH